MEKYAHSLSPKRKSPKNRGSASPRKSKRSPSKKNLLYKLQQLSKELWPLTSSEKSIYVNTLLVGYGLRRATLIDETEIGLKEYAKLLLKYDDIFSFTMEIDKGDEYDDYIAMLVYNKTVSHKLAKKSFHDERLIGELLGYECSGHQKDKVRAKYYYGYHVESKKLGDFQITTQVCRNPLDINQQIKKIKKWADFLRKFDDSLIIWILLRDRESDNVLQEIYV